MEKPKMTIENLNEINTKIGGIIDEVEKYSGEAAKTCFKQFANSSKKS